MSRKKISLFLTFVMLACSLLGGCSVSSVKESTVADGVPEKEGYTGAWNKTTGRLSLEDVTLYAVYTEVKEEAPAPSKPNDSTDTDSEADVNDSASDTTSTDNGAGLLAGCSGVVGGVAGTMAALGIAVVAMMKKKED